MSNRKFAVTLFIVIITAILSICFYPKDDDVEAAYQNAKKGIYWGLSNLKVKKGKVEHKLIANDKLTAEVRVEKEINGVKVVSTGYSETTEVSVTTYRTFETLVNDGFIEKNFKWMKEEE